MKEYIKPNVEIVEFFVDDEITLAPETSGGVEGGGDDLGWGD